LIIPICGPLAEHSGCERSQPTASAIARRPAGNKYSNRQVQAERALRRKPVLQEASLQSKPAPKRDRVVLQKSTPFLLDHRFVPRQRQSHMKPRKSSSRPTRIALARPNHFSTTCQLSAKK
jgi:hypothetical protein